MSKRSIRSLRRAELSQAAFEVLVENGIRNTTLDRVANRAGVSKGVVLHHFGDKDAIFEAVMRRANTLLRDGVVELLRHARNPVERLAAIVIGNFSEPVFHRQVCHAWINLCADVPYNRQSQRIQNVIQSRMRTNLLSALKHIKTKYSSENIARQLSVTVDGLWLKASLQSSPLSSREGIDVAVEAVLRNAGFDPKTKTEFKAAISRMENIAKIVLQSRAFLSKVSSAG